MTEWYVYMEGNVPVAVIGDRREAVERLTRNNFRLTMGEKWKIGRFLEDPNTVGTTILLVGYEVGNLVFADRKLVRVKGPEL